MKIIIEKIIAFILSILAVWGLYSPPKDKGFQVYYNVSYGDKVSEKMDIYIPDSVENESDINAILYVHGGGWTSGDKGQGADYCQYFSQHGIAAVTMNYSLYSEQNKVNVFDMLDEITMCIKEMKSISDKNGHNLKKIALIGFSAGAHLTSLYAYSRANESPVPIAFIAEKSGPYDFHKESWEGTVYTDDLYGMISILSGVTVNESNLEEVTNFISPLYFVSKDSVPSVLAYGDKDNIVPCSNTKLLVSKLESSGVKHSVIEFPNSGHDLEGDNKNTDLFHKTIIDYTNLYFGTNIIF